MNKSVFAKTSLLLIVAAIGSGALAKPDANGGFLQVDDSKNISQLIRSNSNHYWNYMRKDADLSSLKKYLKFEGFVTGDPHLGNFAVMPVKKSNGKRDFAFLDIDFDDAGTAPLVLDFARLMVALKAVSKDIKAEEIVQAYVSGLQGKKMDPPTEIADGLATSVSDFDAKVDKYVSKRVNGNQFDGEMAETLPYTGAIKASDLTDLFPNETVLDIGLKQKDRGGSLDSIRLWVLVGAKDGSKKIFELKQWAPSGTSFFEKQAEPLVWAESVYKTFRKGVDASDYRLVTVAKSGLFWLRQKKVNIVKVDYNGKAPEAKDFAHRLGIYDSWYLGTLHGGQVGGDLYLAKIQEDPSKFKDAVKGLAKDYLEKALAALNANR